MIANSISTDKLKIKFLSILVLIGSIAILQSVIHYANYGFDFSDEGFYWMILANPFIYVWPPTQFGFIYYPLYSFLDGDIALIRQISILITYALSVVLSYVFLRYVIPSIKTDNSIVWISAISLGLIGLLSSISHLISPSYNTLAFKGLLVAAIGMILADKKLLRKSIVGWLLVAVGGWLTFMAKPSSAFALAMVAVIYLVAAEKNSVRGLFLTVSTTILLFIFSAFAIDSSIVMFVDRIIEGAEFSRLLDGGHNFVEMFRIDEFYLDRSFKYTLFGIFVIGFLTLFGMQSNNKKWSLAAFLGLVVCGLLTLAIVANLVVWNPQSQYFVELIVWGLVYACVVFGIYLNRRSILSKVPRSQWALLSLFLLMPHVLAFGSADNYWSMASQAVIFYVLAGLIFLVPERLSLPLILLPIAMITQLVTALLLQFDQESPYRQPQPLRFNTAEVVIDKSKLKLSKSFASYINQSVKVSKAAGFVAGTPVMDLTGQSAGILYAIGAESLAQPWMIGGYKGSTNFALASMQRVSCEKISNSWALFEQDGPRSIPLEVMTSVGVQFQKDYELVGSWQTAKDSGGYKDARRQELYKPLNPEKIMRACNALR